MPLDPEQLTIVALLLAIGGAGLKRLWVFGWTYEAKAKESDFWRDLYLKGVQITDKALAVAEKKSDA